eukprot:1264061-Pleurochrysis_carterae.AAC.2
MRMPSYEASSISTCDVIRSAVPTPRRRTRCSCSSRSHFALTPLSLASSVRCAGASAAGARQQGRRGGRGQDRERIGQDGAAAQAAALAARREAQGAHLLADDAHA